MGFRNPITALSELVADVLTTADSGRRWAIRSDPSNEIVGYTDHPAEEVPATFRVGTEDLGAGMVRAYLELMGAQLWNVVGPAIRFWSEADEFDSGTRNTSVIKINPVGDDDTDGLEVREFYGVRFKGRPRGWMTVKPAQTDVANLAGAKQSLITLTIDDVLDLDTEFEVTVTLDVENLGSAQIFVAELWVNGTGQTGQAILKAPTGFRGPVTQTWLVTGESGTVDFEVLGYLTGAGSAYRVFATHSRVVINQTN